MVGWNLRCFFHAKKKKTTIGMRSSTPRKSLERKNCLILVVFLQQIMVCVWCFVMYGEALAI